MILALDIGNSNITIGAYKEDELVFVSRLATDRFKTPDQYAVELLSIFQLYKIGAEAWDGSVLSSVVPELTETIREAVGKITDCTPMVLGPGVKTGLDILIDNPAQLGADLAAGAVGAMSLYPLPALIIDLGTATKISAVDARGRFCGCAISPGVSVSLGALAGSCSQLPAISLNAPEHAIGTNTVDSMQSGVVYGTAAMIDGIIERFEAEIGEAKTIVATGGLAPSIIRHCKKEILCNGNLILEGLKVIYHKNKRK